MTLEELLANLPPMQVHAAIKGYLAMASASVFDGLILVCSSSFDQFTASRFVGNDLALRFRSMQTSARHLSPRLAMFATVGNPVGNNRTARVA